MLPLNPVALRWAAIAPSSAWSSSAAAWVGSWPARTPTTTTSAAASRAGTDERSKDADATFPPFSAPISAPALPKGTASRIARTLPLERLPDDAPGGRAGPRGPHLGQSNFPSFPTLQRTSRKSEEHHIWGVINPAGTGCSGAGGPWLYQRGWFLCACRPR